LRKKEGKTEEEYNKLLKCREEVKEKRDKLDREYLEKFKKILTAEQILKYQSADRAFFDEFMRDRKK
jgi:ribosomal protein L32E